MIGQMIGPYQILAKLGEGGMGEVYRARDARLGRDVALKVLPPEVTNEPGRLERFDREARAIAALNHPHIVTIYSTEEADGIRFLTMELVEGCTLSDLIVPSGMAVPRFLDIAIPLADALAAAHHKQITHRDLKPGNVMLSNDGRVKVLDFGLARVGGTDAGEQTLIATQAPITHHGTIVGTMPYMSPEQVEGRPLDPRSDLFSLGVIFHELLAGERPFKGSSSPALMSAILRDTPASLADKRSDVPDTLDRLIARLLEKRPEDRVQTARDVFNELRHLQKVDAGQARPSSRATPAASQNMRIAVLPFTVHGADQDAEAMAAGLTDDIAASLARFPGLSVVATQSTRAFKGSPIDIRQIAERVGARFMVSGNIRKSGAAIRLTAQVIDAQTGTQIWTETYDRRAAGDSDVFAIQDDLTDHIVATLGDQSGVLARVMVRHLQGQVTIGASSEEQLILQSWGFQHDPVPPRHAELRATVEARAAASPDNANLWAILANLYICEHSLLLNPLPDPLGRALRAARRAVAIDHAHQNGWLWLALAHFHLHDRNAFEEAIERTTRINPRNTYAMAWIGNMLTYAGDYERGGKLADRAMQLNPAHPGWLHFAAFNRHFAAGDFERALQAARRINIHNFAWMHLAIASAAAHAGFTSEARAAYDEGIRLLPPFSDAANLREYVARWYWDDAIIDSLIDGVQRAFSDRSTGGSTDVLRSEVLRSNVLRSTEQSIAVLPFSDLSEKKDQDWFCDGIAEEILNALAPLPGLRVAARASAFSFRGKADDLRVIAEKLNVDTVLEGSVRRAGDRVRITTQLSDARQGRQMWSERFDRELKDIFDVQEEIARAIAERLRMTLGADARLVQKPTANLDAYQLLLKGRLFLNRRGPAVLTAISCFEQAIALDANLAGAYAGLGDAHRLLSIYGLMPSEKVMPKARAALERALELDADQPDALATLANIKHAYEWDFAESRRLSDRALAVDPTHVRALAESAITIASAMAEPPSEKLAAFVFARLAQARTLDPLNAWVMAIESIVMTLLGRSGEAEAPAKLAIATDPNNFTGHWALVAALASLDKGAELEQAAAAANAMSGRHAMILTQLASFRAAHGDKAGATAIYEEMTERGRSAYVSFSAQAVAAAALGHHVEARTLLAKAIDVREAYLTFIKLPDWRPVWNDPGCAELLRGMSYVKNALK